MSKLASDVKLLQKLNRFDIILIFYILFTYHKNNYLATHVVHPEIRRVISWKIVQATGTGSTLLE
jgi:hypothetical protein